MKLKNEDLYFNKILTYCNAVGITVFYKPLLNNAQIYDKKIYIDPTFTGSHLISVLLHEIGHFEDDIVNNNQFNELYAQASIKVDNNIALNQKEFDCIMKCEVGAWLKGEHIAKKLKIPLGKWYLKSMNKFLTPYYETKVRKNVIK